MKKYKLIKVLSILVIIGMGLNSCNSDFLDQEPTENVSDVLATSTTGNLLLAINGIHRSLYLRYQSQGQGGIGSLMIQNDVLGEDLVMTARANGWFISAYQWNDHTNANDADDLFPFRTYYRIIRNANVIINGAAQAVGSDDERNAAVGQALVYRAWSHFQLVQLYGRRYDAAGNNAQLGVPIRLLSNNTPLSRSTVEEVYTQINIDLDEAINLLNDYDRPNKSHFDQNVAKGLKARIALVQGNWGMAAQLAEEVRADYDLMTNDQYTQGFNDYNNQEWIWGSHIQEDQTIFFANYGAYISRNYSSSNIRGNPKAINSVLYDMIPITDIRSTIFDPTGDHLNLPDGIQISSRHKRKPYTSQKFLSVGTGDSRMDVPYMRAAELYLIEAEAKARLGATDAADILFELAINRDPSYTLSANTGQALIDEILIQRRWELWGEGFRFYDLKRLNLPLDRNGANHKESLAVVFDIPIGDNRWQWLIPQDALNSNSLLEQNPL